MTEFQMISDRYKEERKLDNNIIFNNLVSSIIGMFKFEGLPESIKPDMLIRYLFCNGQCAIPLTVDDPPVCICSAAGNIDAYGYGTEITATTQNGKSYRGKIGIDFAYFVNNTYRYPEFYLLQTSKMLTEVYTSLRCNVINSRLAPIGKARSDAQKAALETGFDCVYKGKPYVIKNADLFDGDDYSLIEHLTDAKDSTYIPYLSQLEDDIIQKFYYHYGLNLKNENKRAQVNSEELQGADALVWTIPLQKLSELEKGIEMLRTKYPDARVTFGSVWEKEYNKYLRETEADTNSGEDVSENESDADIGDNEGTQEKSE